MIGLMQFLMGYFLIPELKHISRALVNRTVSVAHPRFFLARDQGKSAPKLHNACVEVTRIINAPDDIDTLSSLQTQTAPSEADGPIKPLQGPTLIAGRSLRERGFLSSGCPPRMASFPKFSLPKSSYVLYNANHRFQSVMAQSA
jgi:hypothetical protein